MVNLALIVAFMSSFIANVYKYSQKNTVVAESTKSALEEVSYSSITMCPWYNHEYALSKTSGTKNLTEYYESLLKTTQVQKDVVSISQPYTTKNG